MKAEAERRRVAKEDAERKRQLAEEKERERLQELLNKKQRELEEQKRLRENESQEQNGYADVVDGSEEVPLPAIVHDRIKIFKEGEKANKEKQEVNKLLNVNLSIFKIIQAVCTKHIVWHWIVSGCIMLHYVALCCIMLYCVSFFSIVWYCVALCSIV